MRQKANLSQHQLAKALGVSVHTLKSWEQGQRNPSGSARVLLDLLAKRPELIGKLTT
ncbi:helix-turn-helix domain-containing protein [Moraxella lacunata]